MTSPLADGSPSPVGWRGVQRGGPCLSFCSDLEQWGRACLMCCTWVLSPAGTLSWSAKKTKVSEQQMQSCTCAWKLVIAQLSLIKLKWLHW